MDLPYRYSLTLRSRFLLVVLLGVVAPLASVGLWLARTTQSSGEAALRARLEQSLGEAVQTMGYSWVSLRGELLRLVEEPAVLAALREGRGLLDGRDSAALAELRRSWGSLEGVASRVIVRDAQGRELGTLEPEGGAGEATPAVPLASVPVRLPVHDPSRGQIGAVEVQLSLSSLLPSSLWWPGVAGSVLAVFDPAGSGPLLPIPMEPELFERDRFTWGAEDWLVVRHRLHEPPLLIALAAPISPFTEPFSRAARRGLVAFIAVVAVSLSLALLLTRRMTGPLERLAEAADAVSRGELERRVVEEGPDEIRRVGGAFNAMTESVRRMLRKLSQQEAVAAVGEFAAILAHEVRNPLTSIRLDIERARERAGDERGRDLLERALREIERLDAAVTGSLRVARSGSLTLSPIELRRPIEAAMEAAEPEFCARGATLARLTRFPDCLRVRGNAGALEQLFLNLLRNAAEALGPDGRAAIEMDVTAERVRVSVRDNGPGIAAEQLEQIFEPFFSTKEEGTGLGLPIARRIARAHGGDLAVESTAGQGTVVHVLIPRDGEALGQA